MKIPIVLAVLLLSVHCSTSASQNVPGMVCKVGEYYAPDEGCKSCLKLCEISSYSVDRCFQLCPATYMDIYNFEPFKKETEDKISSLQEKLYNRTTQTYVAFAIAGIFFIALVASCIIFFMCPQRDCQRQSTDSENGGESKETLQSLLRENAEVENLEEKKEEVKIAVEDDKPEEKAMEAQKEEEDNVPVCPTNLSSIHVQPTGEGSAHQHKMHLKESQQRSVQPAGLTPLIA